MHTRTLFAVLVAAAMALTGAVIGTASATAADTASTETITLNAASSGAVKGHTYRIVKVAGYEHQTYDADGNLTSLSVVTEPGNVLTGATQALSDTLGDEGAWNAGDYKNNPMGYIASESELFSSSTAAPWSGNLRTFLSRLTANSDFQKAAGTTFTADAEPYTITGLAAGLYVIIDVTAADAYGDGDGNADRKHTNSIPMLVATKSDGRSFRESAAPLGEIVVKSQSTTIDKVIVKDGRDHTGTEEKIGDRVTFRLTSTVPVTTGYSNDRDHPYVFRMIDTMSKGLSDPQVESVAIGGTTLDAAADGAEANAGQYRLTTQPNVTYDAADTDSKATRLTFDLSEAVYAAGRNATSPKAGDDIVITYTALLNKDAIHANSDNGFAGNPNKVALSYSHDPASNETHEVPGPEVKVYTFDFGFTKVKADGVTSLDGAKFTIRKDGRYLKFDEATGLWSTVDDAYEFSGDKGEFTFAGLGEGTYRIDETKVPAGYLTNVKASFTVTITATDKDDKGNLTSGEHTVSFSRDALGLVSASDNGTDAATAKVKNITSITQLPMTGAAGTTLFTVLAVLTVGAGLAIAVKVRHARKCLG